jgi:hypothetical protein
MQFVFMVGFWFLFGVGLTVIIQYAFAYPRYVRSKIEAYTNGEMSRLKAKNIEQRATIDSQAAKIQELEGIRKAALSVLASEVKA